VEIRSWLQSSASVEVHPGSSSSARVVRPDATPVRHQYPHLTTGDVLGTPLCAEIPHLAQQPPRLRELIRPSDPSAETRTLPSDQKPFAARGRPGPAHATSRHSGRSTMPSSCIRQSLGCAGSTGPSGIWRVATARSDLSLGESHSPCKTGLRLPGGGYVPGRPEVWAERRHPCRRSTEVPVPSDRTIRSAMSRRDAWTTSDTGLFRAGIITRLFTVAPGHQAGVRGGGPGLG
jgi:hypothetical protein